jgi:predicted ATPase/DNA-binding SARP family transcriptional activator
MVFSGRRRLDEAPELGSWSQHPDRRCSAVAAPLPAGATASASSILRRDTRCVIEVLGDIRASPIDGGVPTVIGSRNQRVVLAVLAAHGDEVVGVDTLIEALWGDRPPATARGTLSSYVSRLRARIGDCLEIVPGGYQLTIDADLVDIHRYESLARRARGRPAAEVVDLIGRAEELWRGPPFGDLGDADALRSESQRLEAVRLEARDRLANAMLETGRHDDAALLAAEIVAAQPLREASWITLIDAQAKVAPGEALRSYQRACEALADAGLSPSDALRAAESRALATDTVADRPTTTPTVRLPPRRRAPLFGRDDQAAIVAASVGDGPIVAVVGPGGVGKTTLAVAVAHEVVGRFSDGAVFVALDALDDPAAVVPAVLDVVGVGSIAVGDDVGLERLAEMDLLLVLDNCEHVIEAVAAMLDRLLDGRVRVLATSRQRIGVEGERVVVLAPLGSDGVASDGVRMFVECAAAAGVRIDSDDEAVGEIVQNVDGLPLAIEMAAALVSSQGIDDLVTATRSATSAMRSPRRAGPERQRDLGRLIDWSLDRLGPETLGAVQRLAAVEGTFDGRTAASMLSEQAPRLVHELVDASLLVADTGGRSAEYRMLRTVRDRVKHSCDPTTWSQIEANHAGVFADELRALDDAMRTVDEPSAHRSVLRSYADLRAAHAWASAHRPELAIDLTRHLYNWALTRQYGDPFRWAERLLVDDRPAAPVAAAVAQSRFFVGRPDESIALLDATIDRTVGADLLPLLEALADITMGLGDLDRSLAASRRLTERSDAAGDIRYLVIGKVGTLIGHRYAGRRSVALSMVDDAMALPATAPSDVGWCHYARAEVVADDDVAGSAADLRRTIELADSVGNRFLSGVSRVALSALRARAGEPEESIHDLVVTIEDWRRRGMRSYLATSLRNLAILLDRIDRNVEAATLLGALDRSAGFDSFGDEAAELAAVGERLADKLGHSAYAAAFDDGARRRLDDVIDELLADLASTTA